MGVTPSVGDGGGAASRSNIKITSHRTDPFPLFEKDP